MRKPITARRYRPWWYFTPAKAWVRDLADRLDETDMVVGAYLPAAIAANAAVERHRGRRRGGPVFVYDAANDEYLLARQIQSRWQAAQVKRLEDSVLAAVDFVWAAGESNCQSLRARRSGLRAASLPNGVDDLPDLTGVEVRLGEAFTYGSWTYPPNSVGLERIAEVRSNRVGLIRVFGAVGTPLRRRLDRHVGQGQPHVRWVFPGFEPRMENVAGCGAIGMIPVWKGGGTKLRTVQLAGMGVPFIATREALSGLPDWLKREVGVRDDPAEFLQAALSGGSLDQEARRRIRERVGLELSWQAVVGRAMAATLGQHSPAGTRQRLSNLWIS